MLSGRGLSGRSWSPSSRRAWIEITFTAHEIYQQPVALLTEGVDRNVPIQAHPDLDAAVALLAEGVDRNDAGRVCPPLR